MGINGILSTGRGFSRQPSPYPRPVFHTIRVTQLISSIIVMSILSYFVWWLQHDHYYVPWTFLLLLSVSAFTTASIFGTAFFYYMRTLKPGLSVYINSFLAVLWMVGFALLSWNLSNLLTNRCDIENWNTEVGVMICRMYKAVETFTIVGMLATIASLVLDAHTLRKVTRLGTYDPMGLPVVNGLKRSLRENDSQDDFSHEMGEETPGFREPSLEFPENTHEMQKPYKAQKVIEVNSFGYHIPAEQTSYDSPSVEKDDFKYDTHAE